MVRLPEVGGDNNQWGQLLNDFLSVEHEADGTLKKTALIAGKENASNKSTSISLGTSNTLYPSQNAVKSYVDSAVSGASGNYIANGTSAQTANMNITGTAKVGSTLTVTGHSVLGNTGMLNGGNSTDNYFISEMSEDVTLTTQTVVTGAHTRMALNLTANAPDYAYISAADGNVSVGGGSHYVDSVYGSAWGVSPQDSVDIGFAIGLSGGIGNNSSGTMDVGWGMSGDLYNYGGGTINQAVGARGLIDNSDGTIGEAIGAYSLVFHSASTAMTSASGGRFKVGNNGTGSIGSIYGVNIRAADNNGGGTVTNNYGLYIENQSGVGSTASYNFYSVGATAKNYIEGKLQVGSTQTTARVNVGVNTDTTSTGGILFGTDTTLYRSATSTLATSSNFAATSSSSAASGTVNFVTINPTLTQSSTAGYTALLVNTTETSIGSGAKNLLDLQVGGTSRLSISNGGTMTLINAANIAVGTTTGTKIGTANSQKLGFWNATPVVQPATGGTAATFAANSSAIANDTATFDGYTIGQVVKALRNIGILA